MNPEHKQNIAGPAGRIAYQAYGQRGDRSVVMTHSILTDGTMWREQAELLAQQGYYVLCPDSRGHGLSEAGTSPYLMEDLVDDVVALLDALEIQQAHYVGLSLGGMAGFGAGIDHPERFISLCLCAARADMPAPFGAVWDERIAAAATEGVAVLAEPTLERWFGRSFLDQHQGLADDFRRIIAATSFTGFAGCARAIQKLNYLRQVGDIRMPTSMIVGSNDGPLPAAMTALSLLIEGASIDIIDDAGHLPNIDRAEPFNQALLRHFQRSQPA